LPEFRFPRVVSLAVIFLVLGACRPASTPIDNIDPNLPKLADLPPGWTKIEPAGETRCAHDTPYAYWVRPGSTNNIFVYFQGGGGCYNAETCGLRGSYKDAVTDNDNPDYTIGGFIRITSPLARPSRNWCMTSRYGCGTSQRRPLQSALPFPYPDLTFNTPGRVVVRTIVLHRTGMSGGACNPDMSEPRWIVKEKVLNGTNGAN
jgi:hypothetical protein